MAWPGGTETVELPLHQLREDLDRLEVPATEVVNGRGKNSEYLLT